MAILWIINFGAFLLIAAWLGGTAVNGHAEAGHYFLALHGHGPQTEVSRKVFEYSRWHTYLLMCHFAIAVVTYCVQWRGAKRTVPGA